MSHLGLRSEFLSPCYCNILPMVSLCYVLVNLCKKEEGGLTLVTLMKIASLQKLIR